MRVFFSHAWEDKPVLAELSDLPDFVEAWEDVNEITAGEELDPTVLLGIEESHVFIVLLSQHSVSRPWVEKELDWALKREREKDRVFVLPILIDPALKLEDCPPLFAQLGSRLYIDGRDTSEEGIPTTRKRITDTLFRWLSDWLDQLEPRGNSGTEFVDRLERDFSEYQTRLYAVKAVLAWPLTTIVRPDSMKHLVLVKDRYNEFTRSFMPSLVDLDSEVGWRFGRAAQRSFNRLASYVREDIYHGAAFALNDVIESVNCFDDRLANDETALAEADARREERVAALDDAMQDLVHRSADFFETLRP